MPKKRRKLIGLGRAVVRNKIIKKIGLDTDNSFSWMENEKLTWDYKPSVVRKNNVLYSNYVVFSELINLLSRKNPNVQFNKKKIFKFLRKNGINLLKKKEVDPDKVNETFKMLSEERERNKWPSGDNDLRIIAIYHVAGISCISTNNFKDFQGPCKFLNIDLEIPSIIEPGSRQDVAKMWRNIYGKRSFIKKKKR